MEVTHGHSATMVKLGVLSLLLHLLLLVNSLSYCVAADEGKDVETSLNSNSHRRVIDVNGGPESVVWVVQLSDLHFSVHHPDRALDFRNLVAPSLSLINPSLVLITGDLTDGKSKDLLVMKQNVKEWVEYQEVMEDVVRISGLDKSIFYDLRGNHDNFGVPASGGSWDFFSTFSINGKLGRTKNVNSVTLQTGEFNYFFVGLDTTASVGLRGPTNLFGHPTDQLLTDIDSELSQWDSESNFVTKIAFGHFPLSFSASSFSGRSLQDIFLNHSLSAYICGHLHTRFGKNLKRHHSSNSHVLRNQKLFQLNMNQVTFGTKKNCLSGAPKNKEFWEWEMGDWRKSRAMRILAIDNGHISFVDVDLKSGTKNTIIVPTFPLDSRFTGTTLSHHKYECQYMAPSSFKTVRALVFSVSPVVSVVARIYDSSSGSFRVVLETSMSKLMDNNTRGDLYTAPWNYKAFENQSPDRYWLQITATDIMGRSTSTEPRPFSINGLSAKISWSWKEFFVMGCQWAALYYPLLWSAIYFMLFILLIPKALSVFHKKQYTCRNFLINKGLVNGLAWVVQEICSLHVLWFGMLAYVFYLISFPWFSGQVYTDGGKRGYMTIKGWAVETSDKKRHEYIGFPDVMVIVLPHLIFVVMPTLLVAAALAAERSLFREQFLSPSNKKEDDYDVRYKKHPVRWTRKALLLVCLAIYWKHFMSCRALTKAYEMNPVLHFPGYSLTMPLLLAYAVHATKV